MANAAAMQSVPQTQAEYEAIFERMMVEAESLNQQMRSDRIEIERLTTETHLLKNETRMILAGMGAKV